jgi:hypothetical protein
MTAHSVAHDEDPCRRIDEMAIFIVLADLAYVRNCSGYDRAHPSKPLVVEVGRVYATGETATMVAAPRVPAGMHFIPFSIASG